jgi:hypothetical protein
LAVGGIVLAVTVQGGDHRGLRARDAGGDGGALAGADEMAQHAERRKFLHEGPEELGRAVAAAVVHIDDLIGLAAVQRRRDLGDQGAQVIGLVVNRDHHGDNRAGGACLGLARGWGRCVHAGFIAQAESPGEGPFPAVGIAEYS